MNTTLSPVLDIPRIFTISESAHRIHNPFTPEKLAQLGAALRMAMNDQAPPEADAGATA